MKRIGFTLAVLFCTSLAKSDNLATSELNIALEKLYSTPKGNADTVTTLNYNIFCVPQSDCEEKSLCKNDNTISPQIMCLDSQVCCLKNNRSEDNGFGFRNRTGVDFRRIVTASNESHLGEFPWIVAILQKTSNDDENLYIESGSLIRLDVVLTAAAKVDGKPTDQIKARAGEWDTKSMSEIYPYQERNVKDLIIHEDHQRSPSNNVALLILKHPFILLPNISPIRLRNYQEVPDYAHCIVTGWGKQAFNSTKSTDRLKKADVTVVPWAECQKNLEHQTEHHESFICAVGEKGVDPLLGDIGSALACPITGWPDHYYQAGVVQFALSRNEDDVYGVYTNVSHLKSWIDKTLEPY